MTMLLYGVVSNHRNTVQSLDIQRTCGSCLEIKLLEKNSNRKSMPTWIA
ncbi:hypothetical protein X975_10356, partial [Stegodyphus mimosarum]